MRLPAFTLFAPKRRHRNARPRHIALAAVESLENRLLLSAEAFFRPDFNQDLIVFSTNAASVVITVNPDTNAVLVNGLSPVILKSNGPDLHPDQRDVSAAEVKVIDIRWGSRCSFNIEWRCGFSTVDATASFIDLSGVTKDKFLNLQNPNSSAKVNDDTSADRNSDEEVVAALQSAPVVEQRGLSSRIAGQRGQSAPPFGLELLIFSPPPLRELTARDSYRSGGSIIGPRPWGVTIKGGKFDDTIIGSEFADRIFGGDGNDNISGGDGDDTLVGDNGNDVIAGGAGNDRLEGGSGNDDMIGGAGDDTLIGNAGNDVIAGGEGNDRMQGGRGFDRLDGGAGNDRLRGQGHNDTLLGGEGDDFLDGSIGDDVLLGQAGNDILIGGKGSDSLGGGEGDDLLRGNSGKDVLIGAAGNDRLYGGSGRDVALGGLGNDWVNGQGGNRDTLSGGLGIDDVFGLASEIDETFTVSAPWLDLV